MYKCCMCKNEFDGEPVSRNVCGFYCATCHDEKSRRVVEGITMPKTRSKTNCRWCGKVLTSGNVGRKNAAGQPTYICQHCDDVGRKWLLKCIRYSDKAFCYVSLREEGCKAEREERLQREKEIARRREQDSQSAIPVATKPEDPDRLDKIESMLGRLFEELGVDKK